MRDESDRRPEASRFVTGSACAGRGLMPNHLLTTRAGCAALGTPPGVRTIGLARCVAIILSTWAVLVGAGPSHALIGVWGFWESSSTIREASASHIELHGGHAYVSSQRINSPYFDPVSFRILDVSDASLPVSRGALSLPDESTAVA